MVRCLTILVPAMGFILVMAPEIMRVLFSAKYENSAYPFRIYALMLPIRSTSFGAVLMATNHTRTITIGSLLGLIANGVLSVLFVYFIGPIGAAWATVLSVFGLALFYSYIIRGYLQFNGKSMLPWKSIVQLFVAVVLPTLIVITILPVLPKNDILRLTLASFTFLSILFICYHKMNIVKVTDLAQRIYNRFNSP